MPSRDATDAMTLAKGEARRPDRFGEGRLPLRTSRDPASPSQHKLPSLVCIIAP